MGCSLLGLAGNTGMPRMDSQFRRQE